MSPLTYSAANVYRSDFRRRLSNARELVSELFFLGLQIPARRLGCRDFEREPLAQRQPIPLDADEFSRIVAQQAHRSNAEIPKNLNAHSVIALVGLEAKTLVRFDGIEPFVLQLIRTDLVREPDPSPFLIEIQEHASAL